MITTIIPCYNAERFLAEAIESVLSQGRPSDEVIVVDDCSTDSSREIAKRYPVRLLQTPANSGHATARNVGINAANGELIAWLDADDYWEQNHLEVVAGLLDEHPEAAVSYSSVQCFGTEKWSWSAFPCVDRPTYVTRDCFEQTIVPAMSVITRRDAIKEIGGFDESIQVSPDFDLWLRLSVNIKFICTSQITAKYRKHNSQISSAKNHQIISTYESRLKFINSMPPGEDREFFASRFNEKIADEASRAWHSRQKNLLNDLIDLSQSVPIGRDLQSFYRMRRKVPVYFLDILDRIQT